MALKKKARRTQTLQWEPLSKKLAGRWVAADEWSTYVMLIVRLSGGVYKVSAVDQNDGEKAEIFDVKNTKTTLSFAAYWSSGRLTKYRLRSLGDEQVEVVVSYIMKGTFRRAAR